ncbi:MAG: hypothetical protein WCO00_11970 [Rhodospirillaceae bacterium]
MGFVDDLLRRFRRLTTPGAGRGRPAIVDYLNVRRPQRARRLFTDVFAPVLAADDPVLLRCPRPVPGLVLRVDLAGLWAALEVFALTDLSAGVQSALDERAADTLLDDVLRTPEALDGQRRMRDATVQALDGLLSRGGRGLGGFLDLLNRERLTEARRQAPALEAMAPLGPPFLAFVRDYLRLADRCPAALAAGAAGAEASAEGLGRAAEDFRRRLDGLGAAPDLRYLVPLTALHVGRHYGAVALLLRDGGGARPVLEALLGHFSALCACLGEQGRRRVTDAEGSLGRLALILPALIVAGAPRDPECGPVFHADWLRLAGVLEGCLAAAPGRDDAPDLLRLVEGWHQLACTYDQEVAGIGRALAALNRETSK